MRDPQRGKIGTIEHGVWGVENHDHVQLMLETTMPVGLAASTLPRTNACAAANSGLPGPRQVQSLAPCS